MLFSIEVTGCLFEARFQWKFEEPMNKTDLIDKVASVAEVSKNDANRVVNAVIQVITDALMTGDGVTIVGFGTFKVSQRAERPGRNPKTGEIIKINASKLPRFTAGKQLKDAVNRDGV